MHPLTRAYSCILVHTATLHTATLFHNLDSYLARHMPAGSSIYQSDMQHNLANFTLTGDEGSLYDFTGGIEEDPMDPGVRIMRSMRIIRSMRILCILCVHLVCASAHTAYHAYQAYDAYHVLSSESCLSCKPYLHLTTHPNLPQYHNNHTSKQHTTQLSWANDNSNQPMVVYNATDISSLTTHHSHSSFTHHSPLTFNRSFPTTRFCSFFIL
jgi:hypothetical protein